MMKVTTPFRFDFDRTLINECSGVIKHDLQ